MDLYRRFELPIDIMFLIIMSCINDIPMQLILFTFVILLKISDLNIYSPRCWFSIVYYLYAVSYPLCYVLDLLYIEYGCSSLLLPIEFLGLIIFIAASKYKFEFKTNSRHFKINEAKIRIVLRSGNIIIIFSIMMLLLGGYANKFAIYNGDSIAIKFSLSYVYLHIIIVFFYWIYQKRINKLIIISLLIPIVQGLVSGERDVMFHIMVMCVLYLYDKGVIKVKHVIFAAPAVLLLLPLSAMFKYYFLAGTSSPVNAFSSLSAFIQEFAYSEFIAGSRNIQLLLQQTFCSQYDLTDAFFSILCRFISMDYESPMSFFNRSYFADSEVGHGFTIIGEGLLYGDIWGVVAVMLVLGVLVKTLYSNSKCSVYSKTIYLFFAPLFMYSCRGELSTVVVPLIKYGAVSYIIIYLCRQY